MFFPLSLLVMNWVSPLELSYRIVSLRTPDVCLARVYLLWSTCGVVTIGNLCIWVGTRGFMWVLDVCFGDQLAGSWHWEPMHRGGHTFWLSGRKFGAVFEVLCVGWIDDSEIVWCISYNHAHGYLGWQWSIYVTLGFWLMCVLRCYSSTNSMIDWTERIASCYFTTDSWIDR